MTDIQRQVKELKKLVRVDTANYFLTKMQKKIQNIKDILIMAKLYPYTEDKEVFSLNKTINSKRSPPPFKLLPSVKCTF